MKKRTRLLTTALAALLAAMMCVTCTLEDSIDTLRGAAGKNNGNALSPKMVLVNGGTFTMGSPTTEAGRNSSEIQHTVTVSSFYMGKYQVTQGLYRAVTGNSPSYFTGNDNLPMEYITWYDALEFCNKLSQKEGLTPVYTLSDRTPPRGYPITYADITMDMSKNGYRLPTEAEWEYAARGGVNWNNPYYLYAGSNTASNVAWYDGNSGNKTHEVGTKAPNSLGLYDMSGNVYEWCWDWYDANYYASSPQNNPTGAASGSIRVRRGGSWSSDASYARSAYRYYNTPSDRNADLGFRLVRP